MTTSYTVIARPRFKRAVAKIAAYIYDQTGFRDRAYGYIDRLERRASQLGALPHIGTHYPEIRAGLRTTPFEGSAVIVFLVDDEAQTVALLDVAYRGRKLRLREHR